MERINEIVHEHHHLFEAVKKQQADAIKHLIQNHNKNAQENLFAIIFRSESAAEKIKV
jgi:DNA-binding GntR family transcriptional regulator